jgi:hypothetical protein
MGMNSGSYDRVDTRVWISSVACHTAGMAGMVYKIVYRIRYILKAPS